MNKIFYSKFVIEEPQEHFYVERSYIPNTKSLMVYYNGILLAANDDYTEVDEHSIKLNFRAYRGDVIIVSPISAQNQITHQMNNKPHHTFEEFIIKSKQREFILKNKYVPNTDTLEVYCNGVLLAKSLYTEVDSQTVLITQDLKLDDRIVFQSKLNVAKNISVLKRDAINRNKWNKYDEFIVESEEREFTLSSSYVPGTNAIKVFFNGVLLGGDSYIETSPTSISLKFFPEKNDIVVVSPVADAHAVISDVNGDIVGSKPGCMYYRYGTKDTLMPNQKYGVKLILDGKTHEFSFTSAYAPFYSTTKIIHNDLHEVAEELMDDKINFAIWQNSKEAESKFEENLKDKLSNVKNWVRYKTEIDLLNTIYINIAARAGSSQKTLGNMQITKSVKIPYLDELLKVIKRKMEAEENKIFGVVSVAKAVRKANNSTYPISPDRRSF